MTWCVEKQVSPVNESARADQRKKLECLCRYITRPAIAERRLSLANHGNVVNALKTPYEDGTTHVVLSLMELVGRLAAQVFRTRFHGVASPNSKLREYVVPQRSVGLQEQEIQKPEAYLKAWAPPFKRVLTGLPCASIQRSVTGWS